MHAPRLVLASGSPRRRELLAAAGFHFEIDVVDIDETIADGESPEDATMRLALGKAEAVVARRAGRDGQEAVLAADTTVSKAGPGFHVEAMPLAHVRGKERAVQTFRVMGLEEPTSTGTTG